MVKKSVQPFELHDLVYDYLHNTWDPLRIKAFGDNGEYGKYTDEIVLMIIRKVGIYQLANHLQLLVEETMGLEGYPRNFHVESAYDLLQLRRFNKGYSIM